MKQFSKGLANVRKNLDKIFLVMLNCGWKIAQSSVMAFPQGDSDSA